jgi:phage terminase small subunit
MSSSDPEKFDRKRGRHKKHASAETKDWNEKHRPPTPPSWMDDETAKRLLALRREVDPWEGPDA